MPSGANPVFVVGIFRSGTSLLYAMMNQHPQIALMYECNALDFPEFFSKRRFNGNWLERQEFYNKALSRHRLILGNRMSGLENMRTPEELYRTFGEGKQAALFGEKSPPYCLRLRQLARRYPDATFILLWRDPVEIYRSLLHAGRKVPFFHRIGISRLVFFKEQMIRQAAELEFAGMKMHHVGYDDLMDKPEEVCRGICQFLNLGFDGAMLNLTNADLSAIQKGSHFNHVHGQLERGIIERRTFSENGLDPELVKKLQRFQARWYRMGDKRLQKPVSETEPSLGERIYHNAAGRFLSATDGAKRVMFEFLPMPWLATYRRTKIWFSNGCAPVTKSIAEEFSIYRSTILACCLILAAVAVVDIYTPPMMALIPFYMIPSAIMALVANRRWGMMFAMVSALVWSAMKFNEMPEPNSHYGLQLWNCAMRFILLQIMVVLLDRIRIETAAVND
jgi:hypothetical protein